MWIWRQHTFTNNERSWRESWWNKPWLLYTEFSANTLFEVLLNLLMLLEIEFAPRQFLNFFEATWWLEISRLMKCVLVGVCVFTPKMVYPVSKLSGSLCWRGGQRKESLQLYVSGIERTSRYDTLPWQKNFGWQQTKKITQKVNSLCYKLHRSYSILFNLANVRELFSGWIPKDRI